MPKEAVSLKWLPGMSGRFVRHCPQCQTTNLQIPNCVQLHIEILQTLMDFKIDLISEFETTAKGKQYILTVIYMLTNYSTCITILENL